METRENAVLLLRGFDCFYQMFWEEKTFNCIFMGLRQKEEADFNLCFGQYLSFGRVNYGLFGCLERYFCCIFGFSGSMIHSNF